MAALNAAAQPCRLTRRRGSRTRARRGRGRCGGAILLLRGCGTHRVGLAAVAPFDGGGRYGEAALRRARAAATCMVGLGRRSSTTASKKIGRRSKRARRRNLRSRGTMAAAVEHSGGRKLRREEGGGFIGTRGRGGARRGGRA
jgi:hypothetical protein